jgi:release factor glutamine methyltransferase
MNEETSTECLPGPTVAEVLARCRQTLVHAGIESGSNEAVWLLEKALRTTLLRVTLEVDRRLTESECAEVEALIGRRAAREPLQYIFGSQEFYGLDFDVSPAVLIPRPETELLVEEAKHVLIGKPPAIVVDVGTGSGCLAVTLASVVRNTSVYALDCSPSALAVAQDNVARHSLSGRVTCALGDLCGPLESMGLAGQVDVIVSNPPYIAEAEWFSLQPEVRDFEPRVALVGGGVGIEVHRRLLDQAWQYLKPGGWLFMEMGIGQSEAVHQFALATGRYAHPTIRRDAAQIDRIIRIQSLGT